MAQPRSSGWCTYLRPGVLSATFTYVRCKYCYGFRLTMRIDDRLVEWYVTAIEVDQWPGELDRSHARFAGRFTRSKPWRSARQYLSGLIASLDRKNGLALAELAGDLSPDVMQRLLRWAGGDIGAVRDEVRDYVIKDLGDPNGVLIIDNTGFLKKGA